MKYNEQIFGTTDTVIFVNYCFMKFVTAYDIIAHILGLERIPDRENVYLHTKTKKRYFRTKWGFEPEEKYNLRIEVLKLEHKLEKLNQRVEELTYDNDGLIRKKEGLTKQLRKSQDYSKEARREKRFISKLLKEVLDKNVALEKKFLRLENHTVNIEKQLENLKDTKANLLVQYNALIDKNSQQKTQLQGQQKVIADLKKKIAN